MSVESTKYYTSHRSSTWVRKAGLGDYLELTKPRLSMMSVISALFGYFCASEGKDMTTFVSLLIGTALTAGGAAVLNQWMERREDAKMERTASRPIPAGVVAPTDALVFGLVFAISGILVLWVGTNPIVSVLIILTLALYLLAYTPLKKKTSFATHIGALPGAIPPLVGWLAAEQHVGLIGWLLFGVLFTWQIPHFMAIAWMYREDYHKGGFVMLSNFDKSGKLLSWQSLVFTVILFGLTLIPTFYSQVNLAYTLAAVVLNTCLLFYAVQFVRTQEKDFAARKLFFVTLIYLPLYLVALVIGLHF